MEKKIQYSVWTKGTRSQVLLLLAAAVKPGYTRVTFRPSLAKMSGFVTGQVADLTPRCIHGTRTRVLESQPATVPVRANLCAALRLSASQIFQCGSNYTFQMRSTFLNCKQYWSTKKKRKRHSFWLTETFFRTIHQYLEVVVIISTMFFLNF